MNRFRRIFCIFLTVMISFSLLSEFIPLKSDAAVLTEDVIEEDALTSDLVDNAKKTTKKKTKKATPTTVPFEAPEGAELTYRAKMQDSSWDKDFTEQGKILGKPGKGKGIEAIQIGIKSDIEGKVCYDCYLDGSGWTGEVSNLDTAGSDKAKKSVQRIKIYLSGDLHNRYSIFYRVCLGTNGWLGWACDGMVTGNEDYDRPIEAIQIVLIDYENESLIPININGVVSKTSAYYKDASKIRDYMIKKAQKYTSKTKYLVLVDSQYCFLGVFKGKKNHWELIKFWICAPGIYKTYWNRDHEIGVKSKGFYSYNCQVYWAVRLHKELWIHSITYKGHNGKTVLDGRLGGRYSHGCIRLATENAKWIYDNVPSWTRCICYKTKFLKK